MAEKTRGQTITLTGNSDASPAPTLDVFNLQRAAANLERDKVYGAEFTIYVTGTFNSGTAVLQAGPTSSGPWVACASPLDAITANIAPQRITASGGYLRPYVTGIVETSPASTSINFFLA